MSRIWLRAKKDFTLNGRCSATLQNKVNFEQKSVCLAEETQEVMSSLPFSERDALRSISNELGISVETLHCQKKSGVIKPHADAIELILMSTNRRERFLHASDGVFKDVGDNSVFCGCHNEAHMDAKQFFSIRINQRLCSNPG